MQFDAFLKFVVENKRQNLMVELNGQNLMVEPFNHPVVIGDKSKRRYPF
jgi:hypothetical protein